MTNTYKIHSKFLNSINEALQKLASNDEIKILKHPILEADGNFTSIVSTDNSSFDPSKINSNILIDKNEQSEDVIEKKNILTSKAIDKIKQNLDISDELQSILNEINKLNKDTDYNTWKHNEEDNTATLKSKNAYIFLQNDNICLSHDNQVELFHSVAELHNWLKKHNYPLPKNIKLHESTLNEDKMTNEEYLDKLKEFMGEKWFKVLQMDTKPLDSEGHTFRDTWIDNRTEEEKNAEKAKAYIKPNAYSKMSREQVKDIERVSDLKKLYPHWYKQDEIEPKNWGESLEEDSFDMSNIWYLAYQNNRYDDNFYLNDNWREGNLLANNIQQAAAFLNREDAINELKELYNIKPTEFPFKPVQENSFNECGVTCGSLGPAVQYTGNRKKLKEDELLDEYRRKADNRLYTAGGSLANTKEQQRKYNADNPDMYFGADSDYQTKAYDTGKLKTIKDRASSTFSNTKDRTDNFLTYPGNEWFPTRYLAGKGSLEIVNKEQFKAGLNHLNELLPENERINVDDVIINQDNKNIFDKSNKSLKSLRNAFHDKVFSPWANEHWGTLIGKNSDVEKQYTAALSGNQQDIDAESNRTLNRKQKRLDKLGTSPLMNNRITGSHKYERNLVRNEKLKPYYDKFIELSQNYSEGNNNIDDTDLSMFLLDIANANEKELGKGEKILIFEGLLEHFGDEGDEVEANPYYDSDIAGRIRKIANKFDLRTSFASYNESVNSSLKSEFLKLLNHKITDITLKEDDVPADFATNIKSDMDSVSSNASQSSSEAPTVNDSDLSIDSSNEIGNSKPDVNFGDINIAGGTGDYGPEEDEEISDMPMEPVDEYKIVDILVNDDNKEDIKVKVQNLTTGEIETKDLSEIDI